MSETTGQTPPGGNTKDSERQDDTRTGDKATPENRQGKLGERLDEALEETFPSSDPVSVKITK